MSIQVYSTALYLGEVNTEGQLAWITDDSGQKVGRVEIDWGDDTNVDHLAYVYKGEECIANISLDRYMADVGQIMRGANKVGEIRPNESGGCSVYRGAKLVGTVKFSSGGSESSRHLILQGGGGAIVLLGI